MNSKDEAKGMTVKRFVKTSGRLKTFSKQQVRELLKFLRLLSNSSFTWEPKIEKGYCKEILECCFCLME